MNPVARGGSNKLIRVKWRVIGNKNLSAVRLPRMTGSLPICCSLSPLSCTIVNPSISPALSLSPPDASRSKKGGSKQAGQGWQHKQ